MNATLPPRKRRERDFSPARGDNGPPSLQNRRAAAANASEPDRARPVGASNPDRPTLLAFDDTISFQTEGVFPRVPTDVLSGLPIHQNGHLPGKPKQANRFSMPGAIPTSKSGTRGAPARAAATPRPGSTHPAGSQRVPGSARSLGLREERDRVNELENELFRVKQEFAEYRESVEKFPPDLERAHAQLVERDDLIVDLREKVWALKADNTKLHADFQRQQRQQQQQQQHQQRPQEPSSEYLDQIKRTHETKVSALTTELKKLQAQLSTMQVDLNESRERELRLNAPSGHSEFDLTIAKANAARAQKTNKKLEHDVTALRDHVASLEVERNSALVEAQRMSDQKRVAEETARSRVRELENQLSQSRADLESKYASLSDEKVSRVEERYSRRVEDLEMQLNKLKVDAATAKQALTAAETRLADITSTSAASSRLSDEQRGQLQTKFDNLFADTTRQRAEQETQVTELRRRILELESTLASAENLAQSKTTELEVARSQLESSRETLDRVQHTLGSEVQELRRAADEQASQALDQRTAETARLQDVIDGKEKRIGELDEELRRLNQVSRDRTRASTAKIEALEKQLQETTAASQDTAINLDKATKRANQAERAYQSATDQENKLQKAIASLQLEKAEWSTRAKQLEADKLRLEIELEHAHRQSPSRAEVEGAQVLNAKIAGLETELAAANARYTSMGEQWTGEQSRLQAEIAELNAEVAELNSNETARFERKWEQSRKAVDAAHALKLQAAEQVAASMEQQLESLASQLAEAHRELQARQEAVTRLEQALGNERIAARGAQFSSQETSATCQQLREHIEQLSATVDKLQRELAESVRQKNSSAESVAQLTSERAGLIRQAETEIDALREKLRAAEQEVSRIRTACDEQVVRERELAKQEQAHTREQADQELAALRTQHQHEQRTVQETLNKQYSQEMEAYQQGLRDKLDARIDEVEAYAEQKVSRLERDTNVAVEYGLALGREAYMSKKTLEFTQSVASYGWDRAEYYRNHVQLLDGIVPRQRTLRNCFLAALATVRWRRVVGINYYNRVDPHLEQEFSRLH